MSSSLEDLDNLIRGAAGEHSTSENHDQITNEVLLEAWRNPDRYLRSLVRDRVAQLVPGRPADATE